MNFYIATSLSRIPDHHLVRNHLSTYDHQITYDWTLHGSVKSVSKERLREVALLELDGVAKSIERLH